jgi:tetratricopeptide (TPR) repeat protein/V8-like Glu-specific endopeptidase
MKVNPIFAVLLSASVLGMPQIAFADSVEVVQEPAIERLFERGNAAQDARNYAEAEAIWRQVIRRDPNNILAYNNLGNLLRDRGRYEEAIEVYQQTISINPNNVLAYNNLGITLGRQRKYEEAIKVYQQTISINPNNILAYNNLGNLLRDRGRYEEAIEVYQQAIQTDINNVLAYNNLGITLGIQRQYKEAIDIYQQAIRVDINNILAYNNLGNLLRDRGRYEEAIETYKRAIQVDINNILAYNNLGNLLRDRGKYKQAIEIYQQSINISPNNALAYNGLGNILRDQGRYEEAIEVYQKAIQLDSTWQIPQNNLREVQRLLNLRQNPQPSYIDDREWLPQDDPDVPLLRSVVQVIVDTPDGSETGTGWVIKREENRIWILTAHHIIYHEDTQQISEKIEVDFYSQPPKGRVYRRQEAELIQIPTKDNLDLVLLEVMNPPEDVQPLPLFNQDINRGDRIHIIGHPSTGFPWTMVSGEISNRDRQLLQIAQTTVAVGNSGAPVLNEQNRVVGILIQVSNSDDPQTSGFAFAYSLKYIETWLKQWEIL